MSGDAETRIICANCKTQVPRGSAYCPQCGSVLLPAQLRSSAQRRMTPREHASLIQALMASLAISPTPMRERVLKLEPQAKALLVELRVADPDAPVDRALLDRIVAWFGEARTAVAGK